LQGTAESKDTSKKEPIEEEVSLGQLFKPCLRVGMGERKKGTPREYGEGEKKPKEGKKFPKKEGFPNVRGKGGKCYKKGGKRYPLRLKNSV